MTITPYYPEIRFFDIDAIGHVNNTVYFTYLEMARIHFFGQLIGKEWNWTENGVLVAHNEIDYIKPVLFEDKIAIHIQVLKVGSKSFTLGYEVKCGDTLHAKGSSVMVSFDFKNNVTSPIPEAYKGILESLVKTA
jgi:acyl-CoA thioester hydrolase